MSRDLRVQFAIGAIAIGIAVLGTNRSLRSQVPDGWYVTAHFKYCIQIPWFADGRVLVVDPEAGRIVPISGLPGELLSQPCGGQYQGAQSVLVRPEDGAILVGEGSEVTESLDIFLLELDGFKVDRVTRFPVGPPGGASGTALGGVDQMAFLPDGRVLFGLNGMDWGLMLGILDLAADPSDAVSLVRLEGPVRDFCTIIIGMALDVDRGKVYVCEDPADFLLESYVHEVPLEDVLAAAGSDAPVPIQYLATLPMNGQGLVLSPNGILLSSGMGGESGLFAIDPDFGSVERLCTNALSARSDSAALAMDAARGEIVVHFQGPPPTGVFEGKIVAFSAQEGDWHDCRLQIRATSLSISHGILADITVSSRKPRVSFRRGDSNADSTLDISDPVATLGYLFLGTEELPCLDAADSNDTGVLDLSDAVYSLQYLFLAGPAPSAPFGACGMDPTEDDLDCVTYPGCR